MARATPRLAGGEVHVWRVALRAAPPAPSLSEDERARAARYRFDVDRTRYAAARHALRTILGDYLGEPPGRLAFVYGPAGKPALAGAGAWLRFNVAHSAELAVVAVRRDGAVGVDVERVRPVPDALEIAERYLDAASRRALEGISGGERDREFLRSWTRLEAALKASGAGLGGEPAPPLATVIDLDVPAGYVGAVAVADAAGACAAPEIRIVEAGAV